MHWVIQHNLWNETGWKQMMNVIARQKIAHTIVKVIPFIHELLPDVDFEPFGQIYVQGGTSLSVVAQAKKWHPGTFLNDNHNFIVWSKEYAEHCLNYGAKVVAFGDVVIPDDEYRFVRPVQDDKSFAGTVLCGREFEPWKKGVMGINEELCPIRSDTLVLVAECQQIAKEYRFFIVDGHVVTGSQYRVRDRVVKQRCSRHDPSWKFVKRMVELYQPARAFVMDVCEAEYALNHDATGTAWRIIEINNINSSGFYDIDVDAYVKAIQRMKF